MFPPYLSCYVAVCPALYLVMHAISSQLNISVTPRKGMGLLWPSTLSESPEAIDRRTTHEAKPVVSGRKFAANTWIHLYNYQVPNLWGCTGTFE